MARESTGFFSDIYDIVRKIPSGKVATYGQIAAIAGRPRAARVVGYAMHCSPSNLSCHRVVNRLGELSHPDIFGPGVQRALLAAEGVTFLKNGCIDMEKHLWKNATRL